MNKVELRGLWRVAVEVSSSRNRDPDSADVNAPGWLLQHEELEFGALSSLTMTAVYACLFLSTMAMGKFHLYTLVKGDKHKQPKSS